MNLSFWKGKKVLLTGHTGFKGSWLSLWLQKLGVNLIGYSLEPPSQPSLFELARVQTAMLSLKGDIRVLSNLIETIKTYKPEIVIHMAAQSLVRKSYENPLETYSTNVMGTINVLEAVRQVGGVKVLLNITSDKCYDNRESIWGYREDDPMGGYDPYSSSKACAELISAAYCHSFFHSKSYDSHGTAIASARAGNVIGGGDWGENRLIPDIIKSFLNNEIAIIRYPDSIRPWQFVLEPLNGYLMLIEKLWDKGFEFNGGWNFGPDNDIHMPVSWIADSLTNLWGNGAGWIKDTKNNHYHEAYVLKLDCTKAKNKLGWFPKMPINKTLELIVDWYLSYSLGKDMHNISLSEIEKYEEMILS